MVTFSTWARGLVGSTVQFEDRMKFKSGLEVRTCMGALMLKEYGLVDCQECRLIRIRLHRLYCREVCWHFSMERDGLNIVDLLSR